MDQYPQYQYDQSYVQPTATGEANGHAKAALILGIIGIAIGNFVLGIIGLVQANKAYALGMNYGKAKTGKILSIIALVWGIIATVVGTYLYIMYFVMMYSYY